MGTLIVVVIAVGLGIYAAYELMPAGVGTRQPRQRRMVPQQHPSSTRLDRRLVLALLPVWLLVTLWQTSPLCQHLATALPAGMDTTHFVWNLWWMKYALLTLHQFPFITHYQYAPQEINLAFHSFTPLNGVLSVPLQLLLGLNAAFNLLFLAGFIASAFGAFLLARQETGSTPGAFVGSVAFPFAPYVMAHLNGGHFNVVNTWATPFFALFLLRWLRYGVVRDAVLAGAFLACAGYSDLDQVSYCVSFGALAVVACLTLRFWAYWRAVAIPAATDGEAADAARGLERAPRGGLMAIRTRAGPLGRWIAGLAALAGVSALVYLPQLATFAYGLRHGWTTVTPLQASDDFAPDLAGYITPLWLHPLWGAWAAGAASALHFLDWPKAVFVGYTKLLLALLALLRRGYSNVWRWWAVTLLFWSISLGPYLHAWGRNRANSSAAIFSVPLPYTLYHAIPLLGGGRIPGYASLIVSLGLTVLAGHAVALLASRFSRPVGSAVLPALAAFLVLFESLTAPLPLFTPQVDPIYAQLAREPGQLAVLEEPLGWRDGRIGVGREDPGQLYFATVSQKPIISGWVDRVADSVFQYYLQQPALALFIAPDGPPTPQSQNPALVRATLHRMGIGYIILHRDEFYDRLVAYVRQVVDAKPMYEDAELTAYRVLGTGRCATSEASQRPSAVTLHGHVPCPRHQRGNQAPQPEAGSSLTHDRARAALACQTG
jgi:hypothetical protein